MSEHTDRATQASSDLDCADAELLDLVVVWMNKVRGREREKIAKWLEANGQPGYAEEVRHLK